MTKILYVDACINRESSRTERLAQAFLAKRAKQAEAAGKELSIETLILSEAGISGLTEESLAFRNDCVGAKDYSAPMFDAAKQWKDADEIVIAAPYWDLSFPTSLKAYVEQLCVNGLTFSYSEEGFPVGHCKASKVTYVTTVGGYAGDYNMGFDYIAAVCKLYFGIAIAECVMAEGLDIWGNDPDSIMDEAIAQL